MFYYFLAISLAASACVDLLQEQQLIQFANSEKLIEEKCILYALENNWLEAAFQLVLTTVYNDQELSAELKNRLKNQKKGYEKFKVLETGTKYQIVAPAFQWAQSPGSVFLDIKPSHRLDAPGCSFIRDTIVNITENNFHFSGKCIRSNTKLKLLLEFELFLAVKPEECTYSFTPAGRLQVTLKKQRGDIWKLPVKGKKPGNLHIWWEMKEKHSEEMDKITGDEYDEPEKNQELDDLANNPNVVIENSYINGKYVDHTSQPEL